MAFLAVSAPFKYCIARVNPNEELLGRCRQDLFSKAVSQMLSWKRSYRHHLHHQQDMAVFASAPFPRDMASPSSSLSSSTSSSSSSSGGREVYQPFRPPPSVTPTLENLSIEDQLQILNERRGLWFDYAIHVPSLIRAGFTPSVIDEATGMTGVEQNKIVVASQVRSTLQTSGMDPGMLSFFDIGGADLLYELRILSSQQRKSAAQFALEQKMEVKDYRELARAMKDYERRKREEGWASFSSSPGDCLAFSCYRMSKEAKNDAERHSFLNKGLQYADSEKAKAKLRAFMEKDEKDVDEPKQAFQLQVVRLTSSEAGTPSIPYVLPVVEPNVQELEAAPSVSRKGPFTIQYAETAWKSWVALPAWEPLTTSVAPIAISYPNASLLPWKPKSQKELEEPLIVVADKHTKGTDENAYYVVEADGGKLGLQLGTVVAETGSLVLGKVVLALRPPLPQDDGLDAIEWD